jgi:hypothetical protein
MWVAAKSSPALRGLGMVLMAVGLPLTILWPVVYSLGHADRDRFAAPLGEA